MLKKSSHDAGDMYIVSIAFNSRKQAADPTYYHIDPDACLGRIFKSIYSFSVGERIYLYHYAGSFTLLSLDSFTMYQGSAG